MQKSTILSKFSISADWHGRRGTELDNLQSPGCALTRLCDWLKLHHVVFTLIQLGDNFLVI